MAGQSGGPWGGGKNQEPNIPDLDEILSRGSDSVRSILGGRGGRRKGGKGGGPKFSRTQFGIAILALIGAWAYLSFYTVKPEERSVELFLGSYYKTGQPGLNIAPWPVVTREILSVTRERTEDIGVGDAANQNEFGTDFRQNNSARREDDGLMLTGDENIIDVDFQVVWNISDPSRFLFNLADPTETIRAVSESAMREIMARSDLAPILNRDRGIVAANLQDLIQSTLDNYSSGMNVVRVNFDKADPPREVIDSFREVQAAEQERDRLEKQADAYANRVLASARGEAAQLLEEAEGYRAQVVNVAEGEASRFLAVLDEYRKAREVTRKRLYLETMERIMGSVDKVIIDQDGQGVGGGVVPYLPLNELRRGAAGQGG
ncbi:MAG: FtsH protease activity modulator HflK [Rhodobacteraceae bacterium]|nr:FtsH protease activity modulator HflK [Paracoccaceae bacterium]